MGYYIAPPPFGRGGRPYRWLIVPDAAELSGYAEAAS